MGCCGKKTYPSLKKQVADLTLTAANVVANAAKSGQIVAAKDLIEKRITICKGCPQLDKNRCTACGCYIQIKAGLNAAHCPLKKW